MTVSATARRAGPYSCNGATVSFAFSFKVFADADIQVIKTDSDGIQTVLTLTTDYTVSRNADQENNPGGTITAVATYATGNTITIIGAVAYTQTADITNASGFFPEVVENALDRCTILAQQLKELFARVISFPASDSAPSGELVTAANRASKWLAFDASGNPIASVTTPASTTVSAFMATVLDDASALAARTTMGIGTGDSPTLTGLTLSGLTASKAVFTDGSKGFVSNDITGTGNVVMSASPTFTGTITAAAANFSGAVAGTDATDSTSSTTGALKTAGGLAVVKNANIAGNAAIGSNTYLSTIRLSAVHGTTGQQAGGFIHTHASGPLGVAITYTGGAPNNAGQAFLDCTDTGGQRLFIYSNSGIANYSANNVNLSDAKLKTKLEPLGSQWTQWKAIKFGTYLYKDQTDSVPNIGVLANDIEKINPNLVTDVVIRKAVLSEDSILKDEKDEPLRKGGEVLQAAETAKGIYQTDMYMMMGAVLQEALARIETLEAEVEKLKAKK